MTSLAQQVADAIRDADGDVYAVRYEFEEGVRMAAADAAWDILRQGGVSASVKVVLRS